ncbi:MAG TPA: glycosyltransferase [Thermoanaerobaculia bacterium]|nr:glycosyltransferase [Thermoanaerobaculia bacterium]
MKVSVVIAAYDEAANIEPLTRRLAAALAVIPDCSWELIFAVEGEDGTREALDRLSREIVPLRVLYEREPAGLGAAFRRGFAAVASDADYVITLDADLNHQPEEIPRLLAAARERDSDVLIGSRFVAGAGVEGTPRWKRLLSGTMNRLMTRLYGLQAHDKTSGFRVYRARVVREVAYENDQFAFLPELLIRASNAGFRVAEEPIHFRYRREGRSKMAFWPTAASYLALLGRQGDRWTWAALLVVAVGVALRVAMTFPSYKYLGDADCLLTGITALRLLGGHLPVFFATPRIGAIASYVAAPIFLVFGASRTSLAASTLLLGLGLFAAWLLFLRELFGRRLFLAALPFVAVPAAIFSQWSAIPNGYPETLLLCATTLWLAARLARGAGSRLDFLAFGLSAGLGWWTSLLTLACAVPAAAWMVWRRPRLLSHARFLALAAAGFLLGVFPWIAYHVRYHHKPFHDNYAVVPVHGIATMLATGRRLLVDVLPAVIAPRFNPFPSDPLHPLLRFPALLVTVAAILFCLLAAPLARRRASDATAPNHAHSTESTESIERSVWPLCALVLAVTFGLNMVSAASEGQGPMLQVRYLLPIYLVVPAMLALLLLAIGRRWPALAFLLAGVVVAFNLAGTVLPWSQQRRALVRDAHADELVLEVLKRQGVSVVVGSYWWVYPFNFLSGETILGLPVESGVDWRKEEERLPASAPVRLAPLGRPPGVVECWTARAGLAGAPQVLAGDYAALLPPQEVAGQGLLELRQRLIAAWPGQFPSAADCPPRR